ncbi:MAG: hypothetical protein Q4F69_08595 [Bacteroidia bacterium]|nr:hypothetical protein [Bacteroidia bacterium]
MYKQLMYLPEVSISWRISSSTTPTTSSAKRHSWKSSWPSMPRLVRTLTKMNPNH